MARLNEPVDFYEVDVCGPPHDGLWILCPNCLHTFERRCAGRVHLEATLPANSEAPRRCSNCERPQLGYWSFYERAMAQVSEGERRAAADFAANGLPF